MATPPRGVDSHVEQHPPPEGRGIPADRAFTGDSSRHRHLLALLGRHPACPFWSRRELSTTADCDDTREGLEGLSRDASTGTDVKRTQLASLEQLVAHRPSAADGLGGFDRGEQQLVHQHLAGMTGTAPIAVRPLV